MSDVMPFEKFKYIMNILSDFSEKRSKVSDFFESELTKNSFVYFTFGEELEEALVKMLADSFNCWYTVRATVGTKEWWGSEDYDRYSWSNDIEYWLYDFASSKEKKTVYISTKENEQKEIDITSLEDFYNYLVEYYVNK